MLITRSTRATAIFRLAVSSRNWTPSASLAATKLAPMPRAVLVLSIPLDLRTFKLQCGPKSDFEKSRDTDLPIPPCYVRDSSCHMSLVTDADLEKLLASLHRMEIKGKTNLGAAVNVAMVRAILPFFPSLGRPLVRGKSSD